MMSVGGQVIGRGTVGEAGQHDHVGVREGIERSIHRREVDGGMILAYSRRELVGGEMGVAGLEQCLEHGAAGHRRALTVSA